VALNAMLNLACQVLKGFANRGVRTLVRHLRFDSSRFASYRHFDASYTRAAFAPFRRWRAVHDDVKVPGIGKAGNDPLYLFVY
jgi:hypothetical protein